MHTSTGTGMGMDVVTVPLPWLLLSALECGERGGRWRRGGCAETYEATDTIRYETHAHAPLSLSHLPSGDWINVSLSLSILASEGAPACQSVMPFPNEDNYFQELSPANHRRQAGRTWRC
jgi:hypothetical protein